MFRRCHRPFLLKNAKLLAAARIDDYKATAAALQANHEQFSRHQAASARRGAVQHCKAGNLMVDKLLQDYMALLDHGLGKVAQGADTIMMTSTSHQLPAALQDMPY